MNKALTHFYWYGYAVTLIIGFDKIDIEGWGDVFACAIVALSSWGGVVYTLLF